MGSEMCIRDSLKGASAVIEKDLAAGKLAELLEADMLVILTSVDNVCLDYGTENERPLSSMTVAEAKKYMEQEVLIIRQQLISRLNSLNS